MEMSGLLERAKTLLAEVTGLKPVGVIGASKDDSGWHVELEMLEMSRIPPATDLLGHYAVVLDDDGNVLHFQRRRTRLRGEPFQEEGVE